MDTHSLLINTLLFLGAAVIVVPLSRLLKLGTVLGYLIAGLCLGPYGIGVFTEAEGILHFAELGVVLLLFLIGLELEGPRLSQTRTAMLRFGLPQLLVTVALIGGAVYLLGVSANLALVIGLALALSSTAFALQLMGERREFSTAHGQAGFAVLLTQDIAVIPILALLPFLGGGAPDTPVWISAAAVVGLVVVARFGLRPLLGYVARSAVPELFTAATLFVVMGAALAMSEAGVSMALGAFLVGIALADSEFKHQLESDIEPFKGLLLGTFFMAVGLGLDLGVVAANPLTIVAGAVALVAIKGAVLVAVARANGIPLANALLLGGLLAQGGEFAFVIFAEAGALGLLAPGMAGVLVATVTLSMALTPLLVWAAGAVIRPPSMDNEPIQPGEARPIIIAGFGRFGQMVGRVLGSLRINFTAIESSFEQVAFVRRFGHKVFFGDVTRLDTLKAAGIDNARLFILAVDDVDTSVACAELIRHHYPDLPIYARARNRNHSFRLLDLGVTELTRETMLSSTELARHVLEHEGYPVGQAEGIIRQWRRYDESLLREQSQFHTDESSLVASAQQAARDLEKLFEADASAKR